MEYQHPKYPLVTMRCPTGAHYHYVPKYTSVGCYPLGYLVNDSVVLCADCVGAAMGDEITPPENVTPFPNYEEPMTCEECGAEIQSAYARDG